MITNTDLTKIIEDCSTAGYQVKVRDISYLILCNTLESNTTAYKALYGNESLCDTQEIEDYEKSPSMAFLKDYLGNQYPIFNKKSVSQDITFDENKAYMLQLKQEIETAVKNGEMDKKDAYKMLTDISVKLNDKFNVSEANSEQIVVVEQKYDDICPYCRHEIAKRMISKEEAKNMYNLIEKEV